MGQEDKGPGADGEVDADLSALTKLREDGKTAVLAGRFADAVRVYTDGIQKTKGTEHKDHLQAFLSNRSMCFSRIESFDLALVDALDAIAVDPTWIKAYHRCAQAYIGMDKLAEALEVYESAQKTCKEKQFIAKQIAEIRRKIDGLSAVKKVEAYVKFHGTIIGCTTKLSLSMFADDSEDGGIGSVAALGEGNYSMVYKARFKQTGEMFAIKIIDRKKSERLSKRHPNLYNEIKMEKAILNRLYEENHPNIIKLYHTFQDNSNLYFLTELAIGGELWHLLRFGKDRLVGMRPSLARFYLAQTLSGLEFLAAHGVIHRDLKPENLLLQRPFGENSRVEVVKFIDFGTAYDCKDSSFNGPNFVGTPEYMCPETVDSKPPSTAVDIWSYGCMAYQFYCGKVPFKGGSPYLTFLRVEKMLYDIPDHLPLSFSDLLHSIFIKDPPQRASASALKSAKYFEDTDFEALKSKALRPIPSLYETCLEKLGSWMFTLSQSSKHAAKMPACLRQGCFVRKGHDRVRKDLMAFLDQRCALSAGNIYPLFFGSETQARFCRTTSTRKVIGLSEHEHGKYKKAFVVAHLGSVDLQTEEAADNLSMAIRKLNRMDPRPKMLLFSGKLAPDRDAWAPSVSALQFALRELDRTIPVLIAPDGQSSLQTFNNAFGQDYYSCFCGGMLVIVVNSALLSLLPEETEPDNQDGKTVQAELPETIAMANAHALWLEDRLMHGKFCALHVMIISHHSWRKPFVDEATSMPLHVIDRFFPKMQEAGTQLIVCGSLDANETHTLLPSTDLNPKLRQSSTGSIAAGAVRVLRVHVDNVATDAYTVDELPTWLSVEEKTGHYQDDQQVNPQSSDDSISSDSE